MEGDTEAGEATRGCGLQPWSPEEPPPHGLSTSWTPILLPQATQAGVQGGLDLAPSSLGSKVFASLGKEGWADGWGQLQAPLPTGQGSLVVLGPRRPHPSRPTQAPGPSRNSPNPPAGFFPTLRAVGCIFQIPGRCSFLLKFLAPRPIPTMGKGRHCPHTCSVLG